MPNAILYYFPGTIKYPFGHVAIGVPRDPVLAPAGYLSFGKGEGKATSTVKRVSSSKWGDVYEEDAHIDFDSENNIYKYAIMIELPACSPKILKDAIREFSELDRSDYYLFEKNCATAALNFMKTMGCIPPDEMLSSIRPQAIAKRASAIALDEIQAKRKTIKSSADAPLVKIVKLIRNDIERLREQIQYDEIAHLIFKSKNTKEKKIKALERLALLGNAVLNGAKPIEEFHAALREASGVASKTAARISECLYYFPTPLLSAEYQRMLPPNQEDEVDLYKTQRVFILEDDELSEIEAIRQLIDNDLERLQAQIKKDKKTIVGRVFKSEEIKDYKIEKLAIVAVLLQEPINYSQCLSYLSALMKDKKMKGATTQNLQECLDRFPYDRLPQIETMRKFLVTLDSLFITEEEKKKGQAFFGAKVVPSDIEALRVIVPKKGEVDQLNDNEVYEKFNLINDILLAKTSDKKNRHTPTLQTFYDYAISLANKAAEPPTEPNSPQSENSDSFEL